MPAPATEPKHHALTVVNAYEVIALFDGHNVIGVLQGHTHIKLSTCYVTYGFKTVAPLNG